MSSQCWCDSWVNCCARTIDCQEVLRENEWGNYQADRMGFLPPFSRKAAIMPFRTHSAFYTLIYIQKSKELRRVELNLWVCPLGYSPRLCHQYVISRAFENPPVSAQCGGVHVIISTR